MTADAFAAAITGLAGLPATIAEHLLRLSPHMTDAQRKRTLAKMQEWNRRMLAAQEDQATVLREGKAEMDTLMREGLHAIEQAEHSDDDAQLHQLEEDIGHASDA